MSRRLQASLLIACAFAILFSVTIGLIYAVSVRSRQTEFYNRLREKSIYTAALLSNLKEIDRNILRAVDTSSIQRIIDEKILVFDNRDSLIYSSIDNETIESGKTTLDYVRSGKTLEYVDGDSDETVGVHYQQNGQDYVVLASANDIYGRRNLEDQLKILVSVLLGGITAVFIVSFYAMRHIFKPINVLNKAILNISENNLDEHLSVSRNNDELDVIAGNFNKMLTRLNNAFSLQKLFVHNASHELRTPIAIISNIAEEALGGAKTSTQRVESLMKIEAECTNLTHLIDALLLLFRLDSQAIRIPQRRCRIDELIDESLREAQYLQKDFRVQVALNESITTEVDLEVRASDILLRNCFINLLLNASHYSPDKTCRVILESDGPFIEASFVNPGERFQNSAMIFEPFYREGYEQNNSGHGLGLSVARQIAEFHKGQLLYEYRSGNHWFKVRLPKG